MIIVKRDLLAIDQIRKAMGEAGLAGEIVVCQTARAAVETLRTRPAQLGFFGLSLPDLDGLDLIRRVLEARRVFRVLVVSTRRDECVRQCLRPGRVDGFFNPEIDDAACLVRAIRQVADGGIYFSRDPLEIVAPASRVARPTLGTRPE